MKAKIISLILLLALIAGVFFVVKNASNREVAVVEDFSKPSSVPTEMVKNLGTETKPIVAYGQVVSANSVSVIPELPGVVKRVYKKLGDTVRAGETVVELQNSSEQQNVLQARASVSSSQAQLSKTRQGADTEDIQNQELEVQNRTTSLAQTQIATKQLADSAAIFLIDSIENTLDSLYRDPKTNPDLIFTTKELVDSAFMESERTRIGGVATAFQQSLLETPQTYEQTLAVQAGTETTLRDYLEMIDAFTAIVDKQPLSVMNQSIKDQRLALLRGIRSSIIAQQSQITSQRVALEGANNALSIAKNNLVKIQEGPDREDISIAQSGLNASQSTLSSAQIQFSKTFIKAPTFGRISSIETRVGQLVGQSSPVFIISSNSAKRIDTFLSSDEVSRISIGSDVEIDGIYSGTVSRISPTIDQTNGKVKVEIVLAQGANLVEGTGVGLTIETTEEARGYLLPIESVFVRGEESFVYTLGPNNTLVPKQITTESLFGSEIVVTAGLDNDDQVVLYARGLKDGEIVSLQTLTTEVSSSTTATTTQEQ